MNFKIVVALVNLSTVFVVSGCGKATSNGDRDQYKTDPGLDYQVVGPLGEKVKELSKSEYTEDCDREYLKTKLRLARLIDENSARIESDSRDQSTVPEGAKPIKFSGTFLYDVARIQPKNEGWQKETHSWQLLAEAYEKYKDAPEKINWLRFNNRIRSLVTDDEFRIDYGRNMGIRFGHLALIPIILKSVRDCLSESKCIQVNFDSETLQAVSDIPYYSFYEQKIMGSEAHDKKRSLIERFERRVAMDESLHRRRIYQHIKTTRVGSAIEIKVPLADEAGLSAADRKVFENAVSSAWNSDTQKFSIEWKPASARQEEIAGFQMGHETGTRPHVSADSKTGKPNYLKLFPYNRTTSISHEFGHILGFGDHYFTVWDDKKCQYDVYYNETDIMSESSSGVPTQEEREWIQQNYTPEPTASK
jgi:hypothetical protein